MIRFGPSWTSAHELPPTGEAGPAPRRAERGVWRTERPSMAAVRGWLMQIEFHSSERCSVGIEMELEVVDRSTRELASAATPILAQLGQPHPGGEHPKAKHELLASTIEIITGICSTIDEGRRDPHVVERRTAQLRRAMFDDGGQVGEVLMERAAERDVEQLEAAADR